MKTNGENVRVQMDSGYSIPHLEYAIRHSRHTPTYMDLYIHFYEYRSIAFIQESVAFQFHEDESNVVLFATKRNLRSIQPKSINQSTLIHIKLRSPTHPVHLPIKLLHRNSIDVLTWSAKISEP